MNDTPNLPNNYIKTSKGKLYEKICSGCGAVSFVDKRRLKSLCVKCSGRNKKTHGLTTNGEIHPHYKLLKSLTVRCNYPSATNYKYYGGRGIKVCPEWEYDPKAFSEWLTSQGWQQGLEVDRINADGDYSPSNCRLISHRENSQRTRRIKTTPDQARLVKKSLAAGQSVKTAASNAGVTYMVAWHIKNDPDVWSNV